MEDLLLGRNSHTSETVRPLLEKTLTKDRERFVLALSKKSWEDIERTLTRYASYSPEVYPVLTHLYALLSKRLSARVSEEASPEEEARVLELVERELKKRVGRGEHLDDVWWEGHVITMDPLGESAGRLMRSKGMSLLHSKRVLECWASFQGSEEFLLQVNRMLFSEINQWIKRLYDDAQASCDASRIAMLQTEGIKGPGRVHLLPAPLTLKERVSGEFVREVVCGEKRLRLAQVGDWFLSDNDLFQRCAKCARRQHVQDWHDDPARAFYAASEKRALAIETAQARAVDALRGRVVEERVSYREFMTQGLSEYLAQAVNEDWLSWENDPLLRFVAISVSVDQAHLAPQIVSRINAKPVKRLEIVASLINSVSSPRYGFHDLIQPFISRNG